MDVIKSDKIYYSAHEIEENNLKINEKLKNWIQVTFKLRNFCLLVLFILRIRGRRIVDAMHIIDRIINGSHSIGLGCTLINCVFLKEVISGYFSWWIFKS